MKPFGKYRSLLVLAVLATLIMTGCGRSSPPTPTAVPTLEAPAAPTPTPVLPTSTPLPAATTSAEETAATPEPEEPAATEEPTLETTPGPNDEPLARFLYAQVPALENTNWVAISYNNGKEAVASVLGGTEITALFGEDGQLSGSAGCNNYMTAYQTEGQAIQIGPAATTRKMCAEPEGVMQQEAQYLAALQTAEVYRIEGDGLELRTAEGSLAASFTAPDEMAGQGEKGVLSPEVLANLEYKSEVIQSGTAQLVNGEYSEEAAPGSASKSTVQLSDEIAYGALNGQDAAAVVLVSSGGGSGTFYNLAVVVDQEGTPAPVADLFLGDRVQINSVTIENNEIVVNMVQTGPNDPLCCPTQHVVNRYALQGDQLVQSAGEIVGGEGQPAGSGAEIVGMLWKWQGSQYNNDTSAIPNDPDSYTMELMPDGNVAVQADCNRASGAYTLDGSRISMEILTSTMAACPEGSLEGQFLQDLGAAAIYFLQEGDLFIDIQMDAGTMKFAR